MFNFFKRKDRLTRNLDKVVMGAIIGGAIGSVVGAGLTKSKKTAPPEDVAETSLPTSAPPTPVAKKRRGFFLLRLFRKS